MATSVPCDLTIEERERVEAGLDWLLNHDVIDGYSYGVDPERRETRYAVTLKPPGGPVCIGLGPTLIDAANRALDALGGDCMCDALVPDWDSNKDEPPPEAA